MSKGCKAVAPESDMKIGRQPDSQSGIVGTTGQPRLVKTAVDFVYETIHERNRILEYGAGSSTLWFLQFAPKAHVFSVERDKSCLQSLKKQLSSKPKRQKRWKPIFRGSAEQGSCLGSDGMAYDDYVQSPNGHTFDVILIDGRARSWCLRESFTMLEPGGLLIFNDAQRKRYHPALRLVPSDWVETKFECLVKTTIVFQKPKLSTAIVSEKQNFAKWIDASQFLKYALNWKLPRENSLLFNLCQHAPPKSRIVDVGAFNGNTSLVLAKLFKYAKRDDIRVIAIEPNGRNAKFIKKWSNFENLNVRVVQAVAGKTTRSKCIGIVGDGRGPAQAYAYSKTDEFTKLLNCITVDDAVNPLVSVYLLKIDVEGMEPQVLDGAHRVLSQARYVYIEMWTDKHYQERIGEASTHTQNILTRLAKYGFVPLQRVEKNVLFAKTTDKACIYPSHMLNDVNKTFSESRIILNEVVAAYKKGREH